MKEQVLSSKYVLSDDTSIKVLDKTKPGRSHKGYLWTYGNLKHVVYEYTEGRGREGPHGFLENFDGYLQTDGYQVYNNIPTIGIITRLGCWAHARRKLFELKDSESELTGLPLKLIGELFGIERIFNYDEITFEERKDRALKVQKELKTYLDKTIDTLLPASLIAKAINYTLNQWEYLNDILSRLDERINVEELTPLFWKKKL